jgi:hypothetical protein
MRTGVKRSFWFGLTWLLLFAAAGQTHAQAPPSEAQLKAAFIFNFAKFTEWPSNSFAEPASPIVIGVLGRSAISAALTDTVRGKTINSRPLVVQEFSSAAEATNCHVLFIASSHQDPLPKTLAALGSSSVLTIGETDAFADAGGTIGFFTAENKIRFQINNQAARKAGLTISAKLLSLASRPGW